MVAIFVAIMFVSLVLIDLGLEKRRAWVAARASHRSLERPGIMAWEPETLCHIPEGVHVSNTHTWIRPHPADGLEIGADVLIAHALGAASRIRLPKVGNEIGAGQPLFCLEYYDHSLTVPSPITGMIRGVNPRLEKQPGLLRSDPYGHGWVCNLTPTCKDETPLSTLFGEEATQWIEREFTRLRDFVLAHIPSSPVLDATSQDGGLPAPRCLAKLDAKAWKAFEAEFLRTRKADGEVVR